LSSLSVCEPTLWLTTPFSCTSQFQYPPRLSTDVFYHGPEVVDSPFSHPFCKGLCAVPLFLCFSSPHPLRVFETTFIPSEDLRAPYPRNPTSLSKTKRSLFFPNFAPSPFLVPPPIPPHCRESSSCSFYQGKRYCTNLASILVSLFFLDIFPWKNCPLTS